MYMTNMRVVLVFESMDQTLKSIEFINHHVYNETLEEPAFSSNYF